MARYLGPKAKLSRREGTDLFLKSSKTGKSIGQLSLRSGNITYNAECSVIELDRTAYLLVQVEPQ